MDSLARPLRSLWRALREASGDDAYERYLGHWRTRHSGEQPLTQAEFFQREQERKWNHINRCC